MRLDLKNIVHANGGCLPFQYELDLSQLDFFGQRPICEPVKVSGEVRNSADVLTLDAALSTRLHLICDRCMAPFIQEMTVPVSFLLAKQVEDEEHDEILLLEGDSLELDEILTEEFILGMDTKHLCSEDCKGLCAGCGANLNVSPCTCKREIDPRLAVLAKLLEQSK